MHIFNYLVMFLTLFIFIHIFIRVLQPRGSELVTLMRASVEFDLKHNNPQGAAVLLEDLHKYGNLSNTPC